MADNKATNHSASAYADSFSHLADALRQLDLLIQLRIAALRLTTWAVPQASANQQMYISHEEVDWLLQRDGSSEGSSAALAEISRRIKALHDEIGARLASSVEQGVFLSLHQLARIFALSPFEVQVVVICLAPELDRKYDRLYAYVQDDITRKRPSVDLVLSLLCDTQAERWRARHAFSVAAPLFRAGILHMLDDHQSPSGSSDLARFIRLDPRILNFLLENNSVDDRLAGITTIYRPELPIDHILVEPAVKARLLNLTRRHFSARPADRRRLVVYLHGPYGVGKRDLALGICGQLSCSMLHLDLELLLAEAEVETLLRLAFREGLLLQVALYLANLDILLKEELKASATLKALSRVLAEYGWLTFLAGERPWSPRGLFEHAVFHALELPAPDVGLREAVWKQALEHQLPGAHSAWAAPLANHFRLTPGQIRDAAECALNQRAARGGREQVALLDLYAACRSQSNQKLGELAVKIEPRYGWEDIVLPPEKLAQLKEIGAQVHRRYRVFGEWGFDKKLAHGKGLSVLFSGPSGTGKTMAAEVIARELQLDLYKIDLSGVISKYIGETEKNLSKIFQEAETSNAILFFDEADALFGKRTAVSDAHDRYANIETSYLLQKMEQYEGVVILATNLSENMDPAFLRRLRFIVEFPFPDEASRLRIWRTHFPEAAPVSEEIDYEYLSRQFKISGGNIKNIVLNSAFLAAQDGGVIGMAHILHGTWREFEKIGKLWSETDASPSRPRRG
jgi:hypothetical protein